MSGRLEGQVAIVTGAATGLGRGTAFRLAEEGADVVLADIKLKVEETWAEVQEQFPTNRGHAIIVDVASARAVDRMVGETVERLGQLDLIVNNAGVGQPVLPLVDTPDELFRDLAFTHFHLTKYRVGTNRSRKEADSPVPAWHARRRRPR